MRSALRKDDRRFCGALRKLLDGIGIRAKPLASNPLGRSALPSFRGKELR